MLQDIIPSNSLQPLLTLTALPTSYTFNTTTTNMDEPIGTINPLQASSVSSTNTTPSSVESHESFYTATYASLIWSGIKSQLSQGLEEDTATGSSSVGKNSDLKTSAEEAQDETHEDHKAKEEAKDNQDQGSPEHSPSQEDFHEWARHEYLDIERER